MSEREREAKWVLVPLDDLAGMYPDGRPRIPTAVWAQMVERGAKARCNSFGAIPWDEADDEMRDHYRGGASEILAAALGISDE